MHKKDHSKIRYARICKTEEKEIPWSEIVKGFEYSNGEYVVFTEDESKELNLKKTNSINFSLEDEIDSIQGLDKGVIEVELFGEKLHGKYILAKLKNSENEKPHWLFLKKMIHLQSLLKILQNKIYPFEPIGRWLKFQKVREKNQKDCHLNF